MPWTQERSPIYSGQTSCPRPMSPPERSATCASCFDTESCSPGCGARSRIESIKILARQGIQREHSDLFGPGGRAFLEGLDLRAEPRQRLDGLLSLISDFDREIDKLKLEIDAVARRDPRVEVLCQIRGIGRYTAMLVIAEGGRCLPLSERQTPLRLGRPDSNRALLQSEGEARPHLETGILDPPLGARRGGSEDLARWGTSARRLRADREASWSPDRQGRGRQEDRHPLLLRHQRRRDPLARPGELG
jgi:hypothetical protein